MDGSRSHWFPTSYSRSLGTGSTFSSSSRRFDRAILDSAESQATASCRCAWQAEARDGRGLSESPPGAGLLSESRTEHSSAFGWASGIRHGANLGSCAAPAAPALASPVCDEGQRSSLYDERRRGRDEDDGRNGVSPVEVVECWVSSEKKWNRTLETAPGHEGSVARVEAATDETRRGDEWPKRKDGDKRQEDSPTDVTETDERCKRCPERHEQEWFGDGRQRLRDRMLSSVLAGPCIRQQKARDIHGEEAAAVERRGQRPEEHGTKNDNDRLHAFLKVARSSQSPNQEETACDPGPDADTELLYEPEG